MMDWEKGGEKYEKALSEVLAGKSIKRAAKKYGMSESYLSSFAQSNGYTGKKYRRDKRKAKEILTKYIIKDAAGHWFWDGPTSLGSHPEAPKRPRNVARYLIGMPTVSNPIHQRSCCGVVSCINPAHSYGEKIRAVEKEIIETWRASEEAKKRVVTWDDLSRKYDLPASAIVQMVRKAVEFPK